MPIATLTVGRPIGNRSVSGDNATAEDFRNSISEAKVVNTRLVPFTNSQGRRFQSICVDWKNISTKEICTLRGDILAYDAQGMIVVNAKNHTLYATYRNGIKPGQTYHEPSKKGFLISRIPQSGPAARVTIHLTKALQ